MKRRVFLTGLAGGLVAWPFTAHAQQQTTPIVGFVRGTPSAPFRHLAHAFRDGLKEEGFVENANVSIVYRYADNQLHRLPELVTDLIAKDVVAIVGNSDAAKVAQSISRTIPIVFVTGEDPV